MELRVDSWLRWWQERDGEPQKLSGEPSRPVVAWLALARESFVRAVSMSIYILFLPRRSPFPGKGPGGQGSLGTSFAALMWSQGQHWWLVEEWWEAGCVSGELLHVYALMLIPTEHQIHPQVAGAKEVGAMAKLLQDTPIPIVTSGGRICGSLLGNHLPGGDFLVDNGTSKCLVSMARQRALASSLATSKQCWYDTPSPVSRERGAPGEAGSGAPGCSPSTCKAPIGKPGREVPLSPPPRQLSICCQAWDHWNEQVTGCFFPVALQAGKLFWGCGEWGDVLLEAQEAAALCTRLPPSLFWEGCDRA